MNQRLERASRFARFNGWPQNVTPPLLQPIIARILRLKQMSDLYVNTSTTSDARSFVDSILGKMQVQVCVRPDDLERVPKTGPAIVVANHPFGLIEGVVLTSLLLSVRGDVKVFANHLLDSFEEVRDILIYVDPFEGVESVHRNIRPMREALRWLQRGGLLAAFAAGTVAHLHLTSRTVTDPHWSHAVARLARSLHIDRTIRQFLQEHPKTTIVNLGCGLDTTFERIDNGSLCWYDLDLPDVIELRRKFIQESERRKIIASSLLDDAWLHQLRIEDCVLFLAAGVFYYFEEKQIKAFLIKLAHAFPGTEVIFDACSPLGARVANKKVIRDGGMDESAILKWGLQRAKDMHLWDPGIGVVAEYPIFRNMKKGLSIKEKWGTSLSDVLRIMSMVHLRLGGTLD